MLKQNKNGGNKMANIQHLVGEKVRGHWGAGIPDDFGKIVKIGDEGFILVEWEDKRTFQVHMLDFAKMQKNMDRPGVFIEKNYMVYDPYKEVQ